MRFFKQERGNIRFVILKDLYGFLRGERKGRGRLLNHPELRLVGTWWRQWRGEARWGVPELSEGGISMTCDWSEVGVRTIDGSKPSPPLMVDAVELHCSGRSSEGYQSFILRNGAEVEKMRRVVRVACLGLQLRETVAKLEMWSP